MKILRIRIYILLFILTLSQSALAQKCSDIFKVAKPIFSQNILQNFKPVRLQITSDFTTARDLKLNEDPYETAKTDALFVNATVVHLEDLGKQYRGRLKARGNSSLGANESDFPKLKIKLDKNQDLSETPFEKDPNFRINTHLITEPQSTRTPLGRVVGDIAPWRAGMGYKLAQALGLLTPKISLARIDYQNTHEVDGQSFTRNALLLETDKRLAKRVKGKILDASTAVDSAPTPTIAPLQAAKFFLFHKMIGNEDVFLRIYEAEVMQSERYRTQWNTFLVQLPNLEKRPVVYDLDLASIVTGINEKYGQRTINPYFSMNDPAFSLYITRVFAIRQKLGHDELMKAISFFKEKRRALEQLVSKSPIDAEGKAIALAHLEMFFENIDSVMGTPLLLSKDVHFYKSPQGDAEKTSRDFNDDYFPLRPGTPVKVLSDQGNRLEVAIIDIHADLAPGETVVGYINKDSKIGTELPIDLLGHIDDRDLWWQ